MQGEVSERADPPRRSTGQMPNHDGRKTAEKLREQAARCRRLGGAVTDWAVSRRLQDLAREFEQQADEIETALDQCLAKR